MKVLQSIIIALLCGNLIACGTAKRNQERYLTSRSIAPIEVPKPLSSSLIKDRFPVQAPENPAALKPVSLIPPGTDMTVLDKKSSKKNKT